MKTHSFYWLGGFFALIVMAIAMLALLVDAFLNVPDFKELKGSVEMPTYRNHQKVGTRMIGPKAPGWVPISQVSDNLIWAVVSSEDTSYFSHEGVDYHELREALKKDLKEGRFVRGGSTITQQVVKNIYLGRQKTLWRKLKEFIWARELSRQLTKGEVLALYLNLAEWGPGVYGVGQATQYYFGLKPYELSAKQAAYLAMLLPAPTKYHTYFVKKELTQWANRRVGQILRIMLKMKWLDEGNYGLALSEPLWGNTGVLVASPADEDSSLENDDPTIQGFSSTEYEPAQKPKMPVAEPDTETEPLLDESEEGSLSIEPSIEDVLQEPQQP